jgi:hypothetical protein
MSFCPGSRHACYSKGPSCRTLWSGRISTTCSTLAEHMMVAAHKTYALAISATPGLRLRVLRTAPILVRSPSFMPRVNVQALALRNGSDASVDLWELHAMVEHDSNGLGGCLFQGQSRVNGICVPSFTDTGVPVTVNMEDGKFTTNSVRVGLNVRRNWLDKTGWAMRELSVGAEYQQQFDTGRDLAPFLSQHHVNLSSGVALRNFLSCRNRVEVSSRASIAADTPVPSVARVGWSVQGSCFPSERGGFASFIRYESGQDTYNLGFLDNLRRWLVGLTFSQDGFIRFRPR